jgi:hypothetical protein
MHFLCAEFCSGLCTVWYLERKRLWWEWVWHRNLQYSQYSAACMADSDPSLVEWKKWTQQANVTQYIQYDTWTSPARRMQPIERECGIARIRVARTIPDVADTSCHHPSHKSVALTQFWFSPSFVFCEGKQRKLQTHHTSVLVAVIDASIVTTSSLLPWYVHQIYYAVTRYRVMRRNELLNESIDRKECNKEFKPQKDTIWILCFLVV